MKLTYESNYKTRVLRDDELMHFKYIKREKKNGRWVYYYDTSADVKARNKYNKALNKHYITKADDIKARDRARQLGDMHEKLVSAGGYRSDALGAKTVRNAHNDAKKTAASTSSTARVAGLQYIKAKKEYQTYKIKTLLPRVLAKGAVKVANYLSRFSRQKFDTKKATSKSTKKSTQKRNRR